MKQRFWRTLSVFSLLLSISYHPPTLAQGNGNAENKTHSRPILQLGNQGSAVSQIQAILKLLGYYTGEVTGIFDESTQNAVSRFQEAAGLPVDGIFGQQSWHRLLPLESEETASEPTTAKPPTTIPVTAVLPEPPASEINLPTLRLGMTGEAVKRLQSRLQTLGYLEGTVDGVFGEQTLAAVKAAQAALNLEVDGIVGKSTWEALRR
jgi:peptidoglycan hydrolase-like protein with peptidoglycan-binding domain